MYLYIKIFTCIQYSHTCELNLKSQKEKKHRRACRKNLKLYVEIFTPRKYSEDEVTEKNMHTRVD